MGATAGVGFRSGRSSQCAVPLDGEVSGWLMLIRSIIIIKRISLTGRLHKAGDHPS